MTNRPTTRRTKLTDDQVRAHAETVRQRSGRHAVVRYAGMLLAVALDTSELDARRIVERIEALMLEHGELTLDVYRRLNPPTHRSAQRGNADEM